MPPVDLDDHGRPAAPITGVQRGDLIRIDSVSYTHLTLPTTPAWAGIGFASLLAFFAFIGFEDLTNGVEETHQPERNIPLAMALVLGITTILYVLIAAIAVTAVPIERLTASAAPLSLVFRELTG